MRQGRIGPGDARAPDRMPDPTAPTVVVAGHACVDLVPALAAPPAFVPGSLERTGPLSVRLGGCVPNTGLALVELGIPARLETTVGDDVLGAWLSEAVEAQAPGLGRVRVRKGAATSCSIVIEVPGRDRMFLHHAGANDSFDGRDVDLAGATMLHIGYLPLLTALLERRGEPLRALLGRARDAGITTSVDLAVIHDPPPSGWRHWTDVLATILPLVDIVSPSTDDLVAMLQVPPPGSDAERTAMAGALLDHGAAIVVLTDGPRGMVVRAAGRGRLERAGGPVAAIADSWAGVSIVRPAPPVEIVSTVGAGDAATAGVICAIATGLGADATAALALRAAGERLAGRPRLSRIEPA